MGSDERSASINHLAAVGFKSIRRVIEANADVTLDNHKTKLQG